MRRLWYKQASISVQSPPNPQTVGGLSRRCILQAKFHYEKLVLAAVGLVNTLLRDVGAESKNDRRKESAAVAETDV